MSSPGGENTINFNNNTTKNTNTRFNTVSSPISSKSSSSSSSSSNFRTQNTNNHKTMEEVWKDINLTSLHDHPHGEDHIDLSVITPRLILHNTNQNPNFILQDFLAKDPPSRLISSTRVGPTNGSIDTSSGLLASSPVPPPPATVLSLYSGPGFDYFDHSDHNPLRPLISSNLSYPRSNVPSFGNSFEGLDTSSALLTSFGRKRVLESDTTTGDRRHKRMIKNRESAARSRARKQELQAYTNELELEVQHLMEENSRLRRQQEELRLAAAAQLPKKRTLYRTSTAPF